MVEGSLEGLQWTACNCAGNTEPRSLTVSSVFGQCAMGAGLLIPFIWNTASWQILPILKSVWIIRIPPYRASETHKNCGRDEGLKKRIGSLFCCSFNLRYTIKPYKTRIKNSMKIPMEVEQPPAPRQHRLPRLPIWHFVEQNSTSTALQIYKDLK